MSAAAEVHLVLQQHVESEGEGEDEEEKDEAEREERPHDVAEHDHVQAERRQVLYVEE